MRTNAPETEILGLPEPTNVYKPQGCNFCNGTGYKGRVAVHEMMYINENMRNAIVKEKNLEKLREIAKQNGMVTLWNSCRSLVLKGVTSIQELMTLNIE
jgi:type IV pilus assembly protein PilB